MTRTVPQPLKGPNQPIPAAAGIGLRGPYHAEFLRAPQAVAWLEAHSENFFAADGIATGVLERIRRDYPLSLHGVGLSIGSVDPIDATHLTRLTRLIERVEPCLVSEHLCWGSIGGHHLNDLLPLPYTEEALAHVMNRIDQLQDRLGRRLLIENVSTYLEFVTSAMPEWEFLTAVAERTGCGVLLDVNNVHVNAFNHGFDAATYIDALPAEQVVELHLGGHTTRRFADRELLVDTHNTPVCEAVWKLFERAVHRIGPRPTLIERDSDYPPLTALIGEAHRAQAILDAVYARAA